MSYVNKFGDFTKFRQICYILESRLISPIVVNAAGLIRFSLYVRFAISVRNHLCVELQPVAKILETLRLFRPKRLSTSSAPLLRYKIVPQRLTEVRIEDFNKRERLNIFATGCSLTCRQINLVPRSPRFPIWRRQERRP